MSQSSATTDIRRDLVALLPRLRRFALTLVPSASEADILVRDVCARAIQKSHHWKGEGRIESWLFSMMRSQRADDLRKRRRIDAGVDVSRAGASPELGKSAEILFSLPEGLASAVLLADVEGFTYKEASAILALSTDLFASRLCAARLRLAALGVESAERRA
jgi:RNA polymerase sigma-70 factor (ECF subfamily)